MTVKSVITSVITFLLAGALSFSVSIVFTHLFLELHSIINWGIFFKDLPENFGTGILAFFVQLFSFIVIFPLAYHFIKKQTFKVIHHD